MLVSAALARGSRWPATVPPEWVRGLADGTITAAVALGAAPQPWQPGGGRGARPGGHRAPGARAARRPGWSWCRSTTARALGAGWILLDREALGDAVSVEALPALDATRAVGQLTIRRGRPDGRRRPEQVLVSDEDVRGLALTLAAAESAGIARWCLETASEYAKVRVQFGRPIGQFQAVKHALADMLVAVEQSCGGGLGRRRRLERGRGASPRTRPVTAI